MISCCQASKYKFKTTIHAKLKFFRLTTADKSQLTSALVWTVLYGLQVSHKYNY